MDDVVLVVVRRVYLGSRDVTNLRLSCKFYGANMCDRTWTSAILCSYVGEVLREARWVRWLKKVPERLRFARKCAKTWKNRRDNLRIVQPLFPSFPLSDPFDGSSSGSGAWFSAQ